MAVVFALGAALVAALCAFADGALLGLDEDEPPSDGRIRATFATVWLSGWAPHGSQQKPARRGSATVSLADALKTP